MNASIPCGAVPVSKAAAALAIVPKPASHKPAETVQREGSWSVPSTGRRRDRRAHAGVMALALCITTTVLCLLLASVASASQLATDPAFAAAGYGKWSRFLQVEHREGSTLSCGSPTFCLYEDGEDLVVWDGHSWSKVSPPPGTHVPEDGLMTCPAPHECVGVSYAFTYPQDQTQFIVATTNGLDWKVLASGEFWPTTDTVSGFACSSPNYCVIPTYNLTSARVLSFYEGKVSPYWLVANGQMSSSAACAPERSGGYCVVAVAAARLNWSKPGQAEYPFFFINGQFTHGPGRGETVLPAPTASEEPWMVQACPAINYCIFSDSDLTAQLWSGSSNYSMSVVAGPFGAIACASPRFCLVASAISRGGRATAEESVYALVGRRTIPLGAPPLPDPKAYITSSVSCASSQFCAWAIEENGRSYISTYKG